MTHVKNADTFIRTAQNISHRALVGTFIDQTPKVGVMYTVPLNGIGRVKQTQKKVEGLVITQNAGGVREDWTPVPPVSTGQ